jgi:hypothetical protein
VDNRFSNSKFADFEVFYFIYKKYVDKSDPTYDNYLAIQKKGLEESKSDDGLTPI